MGELAWVWAKDFDVLHPFWRHRHWFVGDRLAAWGWACLPYRVPRGDASFRQSKTANLTWQTHPDRPAFLHAILRWFDDVADGLERSLTVQSADAAAQEIVAAHGYTFDAEAGSDDGTWVQFNARELDDIPRPMLAEGFRFRTAAGISCAQAVQVHLDAWPSSTLTEAAFDRVRRTWPYRADLHALVAAPDGTLVASAIIWLDEATRTAEFEPVGTHRDFRRRGLGKALQLHGMQLARAAGAQRMFAACRGGSAHVAARDMYYGVGFRAVTRDLPQIKPAGGAMPVQGC
ncbi:GNAT family N-acetyltransferase [Leptolyngbya sp. 15MV]|nr:GNAT family N-acetyltransferase [Leptolyngbya sp. 15MV]